VRTSSGNAAGGDLRFVFQGDRMLLRGEATPYEVPGDIGLRVLFEEEIGEIHGRRCFAAEVEGDAPEGAAFQDLRSLLGVVDERVFAMAGRAKQVIGWNRDHRFCGRCGARTGSGTERFSRKCPECGALYFPRLSPAAIVLVSRGEEVLLARSPHFAPGMYSALAGFVEPGESVEETVAREVREEVGIEVKDITYFGSQPWPFPNSLMIGFLAEHAGGELRPDPSEIENARWFETDSLPKLPPLGSIARALVEEFISRRGRCTGPSRPSARS
jgi:NAD+ diphosphatase